MKKILFFQWNAIMQKDVEDALRKVEDVQLDCISYEFADWDEDEYFKRRFPKYLLKDKYDMVFSVNFFPVLSDVCEEYYIPYVSWVYDAPMHIKRLEAIENKCNYIFLFDRGQFKEFINQGYKTVYHMPLGVNVSRLDNISTTKEEKEKFSSDISFVGKLYESDMEYLLGPLPEEERERIIDVLCRQVTTYGEYILDDFLSEDYMKHINTYYKKASGNDNYEVSKREMEYAMATYITRWERQEILCSLSESYNIDLYSYNVPEDMNKVRCKEVVGYYRDMPKVFKNSKINLNISFKQIKEGIPLRIFDILGAGGFLITNYQKELEDYFEIGKDLVVYESIDDLCEKVGYYLEHEEERIEIAKNGYKKVAEYYSFDVQLNELLNIVWKEIEERGECDEGNNSY